MGCFSKYSSLIASGGVGHVSGFIDKNASSVGVKKLAEKMNDMKIRDDKKMEAATLVDGNETETRHTISHMAEHVVGHESFGLVFQAKCFEMGEIVAVKKVLQDKRYKNRELQTMRFLGQRVCTDPTIIDAFCSESGFFTPSKTMSGAIDLDSDGLSDDTDAVKRNLSKAFDGVAKLKDNIPLKKMKIEKE
ncbi:hypothetical protein TSUD_411490 [Trifolium subterraneum]|uniref:Protein kinase domain-containing protein n=1 Tax=Trifolium subterraneum TaxID=3900 RepID=A0A2Z6P3J0_TRISU|nr:hypothetical protein TSUD_411490 [Trifolium subterraneum]